MKTQRGFGLETAIRTSERFIEETFDIREKNQVDNPQLLLLHVLKEDGIVKIQESP